MSEKKIVSENDILDYILQTLYLNLDKNELHLETDILAHSGLQLEPKQIEHLRELVMTTGLVHQSIGFGKNGRVYLNGKGIQVMKKYKSYLAFLQHEELFPPLTVFNPPKNTTDNPTPANKSSQLNEEPPLRDDDMAH